MRTGKRGTAIITAAALAIMWLLPSWRTQAAEAVTGIPAVAVQEVSVVAAPEVSAVAVPEIPSGPENTTGMLLGAVAAGAMQAEGTELKVYVAVQAIPGTAGIDHVNIQFKNPANDRTVTKILRDKDYANGVYAGWMTMSIYEPAGFFVLDKVILQDNNGGYLKYCRAEDRKENDKYQTLPVTAGFQIMNGVAAADETPPVLGAVVVTPAWAARESEITVTAAVADDFSGVDTVAVRFENENGKAVTVNLEKQDDLYSAVIKKSQTKEAGTYRLKRVSVSDNMGNSKIYNGGDGPFASDCFFVIQ